MVKVCTLTRRRLKLRDGGVESVDVSRWCLGRVEMSGRCNREATSRKSLVESMKSGVGETVGGKMRAVRTGVFVMKAVARIRRL
jgi:hypothetical protein